MCLMKKQKTKERILQTAATLFGMRGIDGVSAAEIARTAQVNKALIFYYFGSKDGLYRAVFRNIAGTFVKGLRSKMKHAKPGYDTIETFIRNHITILRNNPTVLRMLIRELDRSLSKETTSIIREDMAELLKPLKDELLNAITYAVKHHQIRPVDPFQTAVSIISLDVFFLLGKPIVQVMVPRTNADEFEKKRVEHILDLFKYGIVLHKEKK
jgi:TetR/AcrR family transcriptional regulator